MVNPMVKRKRTISQNFTVRPGRHLVWVLPVLSLLTFILSWAAVYPSRAVEGWYARRFFPVISGLAGRVADAVAFSWLDAAVPLGIALLVLLVRARRWGWMLNVVAGVYLFFFWSWGLNYHRLPLASKLQMDPAQTKPEAMEQFARHAAAELNRLYVYKRQQGYDENHTREEAAARVRQVVRVIDGSDWEAARRIKISWIANPWLHAAGIDGVFNPIGHEPVISNTVLDVERPFIIAHELAHVRGYPDEGDANLVAVFATLMSNDPAFQYSGWLNLWLYVRTRELDQLLESGPQNDLQRMFDRARAEEIRWISDVQRIVLDWFLKANNVGQGIRSYSKVAILAAGSEPYWDRYR